MRVACVLLTCLLLAAGCQRSHKTVLGNVPNREMRSILSVRAGTTPSQVNIHGVMVEKCPTAGCWFRLRDKTGTIKVDTRSAGFVVVNVPLQKEVTVAGKIIPEGDDVMIEATGLSY